MSLLFLLIIVVAEVNNVSATVVRAQHARKGPNVVARRAATNEKANNRAVKTNAQRQRETRQEKDNDKKEEEAENEKREKPSDEDDEKGNFLPDMIRKIKCDKSKVKLVFREARKQGVKLSKGDIFEVSQIFELEQSKFLSHSTHCFCPLTNSHSSLTQSLSRTQATLRPNLAAQIPSLHLLLMSEQWLFFVHASHSPDPQ